MKKLVLFLFVFATSTLCTLANVENEVLGGVNIYLSCSRVQGHPLGRPGGLCPMMMPTVHLTGNKLTIPESLIGYEMVITSESGDVFFSTSTISTEVVIPNIPDGSYLIEFIGEDYYFSGLFTIE